MGHSTPFPSLKYPSVETGGHFLFKRSEIKFVLKIESNNLGI